MRKLFVFFLCGMVMCACKNTLEDVDLAASKYDPAREVAEGVEIIYSEDGTMKMRLLADQIIHFRTEDAYTEFPRGVVMYFYNEAEEVTSKLKSKYAIRYEKREETIFRDSVYVRNIADEKLYTDELIWDEPKKTLHSDKFVKVITPTERLIGTGFRANEDFTNYKVLNITGIFNVEDQNTEGL